MLYNIFLLHTYFIHSSLYLLILHLYLVPEISLFNVQLLLTPWITECQAPLCMEFSRQEYWSGQVGILFLQRIFPAQGLNPVSYIVGRFFTI